MLYGVLKRNNYLVFSSVCLTVIMYSYTYVIMYSDTLIYRGLGFGFDHSTNGPYYQFFLLHVYQPNTYLTMCDINFSLAED